MKQKLPTYARGDSIGIAVCPTGVRLDEVEIDMLLYTTGNGVRLYASTRGKGLPIVKGAERAVFNIPPSESIRLDAGIATLETTYIIGDQARTLTDRILILTDAKIADYSHE